MMVKITATEQVIADVLLRLAAEKQFVNFELTYSRCLDVVNPRYVWAMFSRSTGTTDIAKNVSLVSAETTKSKQWISVLGKLILDPVSQVSSFLWCL